MRLIMLLNLCFILFNYDILLLLDGDVEFNPGSSSSPFENFSICHWSLFSLTSHNFIEKYLLLAFNSIYKFDIICLSETFLNSSYAIDSMDLNLHNYLLVRADHPLDVKRGGVYIIKIAYQ